MDIVEEVVEKVTLRQLKARYGNGIQYSVLQTAENSRDQHVVQYKLHTLYMENFHLCTGSLGSSSGVYYLKK